MPRKKPKKKSGPEESGEGPSRPAIPGLTTPRSAPSSSREQQPVAGGSRPAQHPRQPEPSSSGRSRQEAPDSQVPRPSMRDDPSCSEEQRATKLSQSFENMALVPAIMPKKPKQPGRLGRKIKLVSNLYPLKFDGCYVYHYDVEVSRVSVSESSERKDDHKKYRCLNTKVNRKVFKRFCDENFRRSFAVFDGEKNVYCMEELPIDEEKVFDVKIEAENQEPDNPQGPRMDTFQIKIKPVRKKETCDNIINLEPLTALFRGQTSSVPPEAIMVLETVLRYIPCQRFVPVGRNFFTEPKYKNPLGNGKEVWFGHHQSIRLAQNSVVVNLDMSASSFYESIPVIDYIEKLIGRNIQGGILNDKDLVNIKKDIKNISVETTHQSFRRKYNIEGLSQSANKEYFDYEGRKITVENYYKIKYRVQLRFPHLPCLKVRKRSSVLPMEICNVVKGQHSRKELNPRQQAEMIKFTAKPPQQRFAEIGHIYKSSEYHKDPFLERFGLRVLDTPLKTEGRTLEAPNVIYKQNSHEYRERPRNGAWNMRDKQFFAGTRIDRWTLLSFASRDDCNPGKLKQFADALVRFGNQQGVQLNQCFQIETAEAKLQSVSFHIDKMKQKGSQLIFVVLPSERQRTKEGGKLSQMLYSEVKRVAETNFGIVTQCVKAENVSSKGTNPSFVSNLCLKMNAKMGGVNNSMVPAEVAMQPEERILFVGADVNHPAPTEDTSYSLAATVGNVDSHPSRYAVIVRAQKNDENFKQMVEVIMNMEEMMKYLLLTYYRNNGKAKPKKIIIYRDGVSDGQFSDVQNREIKWIRAACTSIESGYKPGITFIVVQKRHHVRFLPEQTPGNPPAGTVVDTTATHPLNYDFFLYSHAGMKGTSRPSYYTVLADDNGYGFDSLEKMTYSLCHTYVRCTKSISLPAPVQYADLAAYRARRHLNSTVLDLEARGKLKRNTRNKFDIPFEQVNAIVDVKESMRDTMYYA